MFGYLIYYSNLFGIVKTIPYLCITESVITPTGGEPSGGRVDSTALYIYIYPPFFTNIIITLRVYFFYLILLLNNPPIC